MHFLVTNDDGIDAPGLAILARVAAEFAPVTVVGPVEAHSGGGHRVSTTQGVAVLPRTADWHAVGGTPADCTRLGLLHVAPQATWVLSGVNEGGNLGVDTYMSGTVAAVREGVWLGRPGIAFSQYRRSRDPINWERAEKYVRHVLSHLVKQPLRPGAFWNVNFPDPEDATDVLPELALCPLERAHLAVQFEIRDGQYHYIGRYHDRLRTAGSDVDQCFAGKIAITEISPCLSH